MSCALFLRSRIWVRWNSTARQLRKSGEDYDIIHTFYLPLPHSVCECECESVSVNVSVSMGVCKSSGAQGRQRDARAYIRPPGSPTPATQKQRSPRNARGTPGRTSDPLAVESHACHAKAAEPKERQRDARGTPGRTSDPLAVESHTCHAKTAEPKEHQRDARGTPGRTSDPLAVEIVTRLPRKSTGAHARNARGTREGRQGVHPTPWQWSPTPATQKQRSPRNARGTPAPEERQGVHPTPWQWRLSHACQRQRDARGTLEGRQGAHPTPWQWSPTPATQKQRSPRKPEGRQGVHPTPLAVESHTCHAKAAEPKERQRDARAYIRPPGSGDWVSEWASERVSERVIEWVSECVSEWVSVRVCVCEWVSEWVRAWVGAWVSEWVSDEWGGGREGGGGRRADTELKTKNPHVNVGKSEIPCSVRSLSSFTQDAQFQGRLRIDPPTTPTRPCPCACNLL